MAANGKNVSARPADCEEIAGINLSALAGHLWEAANILRGPVDAADFKTYIFPLLFFKRISDVYDEELADAMELSGGDQQFSQFPENHRFQIPEGCHWEDVRAKTGNVGQALQRSLREIEKANPDTLYGIFGDANWTNKDRLSDALLRDLIEHFSRLSLGNKQAQTDILGQAYEYLIKKFADATNKKAGEFYTPRSVVRLLINILDPQEGETIDDPTCGTGGMLLEAIHHVRAGGGNVRTLYGRLFGQEKNLTTSAIARMNLLLHGVEDFRIVRGDTLREPAFFSGDQLMTFDCVIANPPFSLDKWGEEVWVSDPYGRNFAGMPPAKTGDYAWVQHMIKSMAPKTGRMAVVLPHGALFRMAAEGRIRQKILEMDILDAVIGLGPNLFYGTGLAACIMVFRARKPKERRQRVLFIDASREFKKGRQQNELLPEHVDRIYAWYKQYADIAGVAKVVPLDDIRANDFNLNIPRYVEPLAAGKTVCALTPPYVMAWNRKRHPMPSPCDGAPSADGSYKDICVARYLLHVYEGDPSELVGRRNRLWLKDLREPGDGSMSLRIGDDRAATFRKTISDALANLKIDVDFTNRVISQQLVAGKTQYLCVLTRVNSFKVCFGDVSWSENAERAGTESAPGKWRELQGIVGKSVMFKPPKEGGKQAVTADDIPPSEAEEAVVEVDADDGESPANETQ